MTMWTGLPHTSGHRDNRTRSDNEVWSRMISCRDVIIKLTFRGLGKPVISPRHLISKMNESFWQIWGYSLQQRMIGGQQETLVQENPYLCQHEPEPQISGPYQSCSLRQTTGLNSLMLLNSALKMTHTFYNIATNINEMYMQFDFKYFQKLSHII